jgi:general stress protein YciG
MNPKDSGHKGGIATRDNHITLCSECGHLIKSQFYSETGAKGGATTLKRYGREHYTNMGKKGGRGNKRNKDIKPTEK